MTQSRAKERVVRPRLFWRLLFLQVVVLGAFLYISLISLGGYLLLLGFDAKHSQQQRLMALAGGGVIMLVGVWLLKVAVPRRISPVLVEPEN
jgi:membrane protein DedA with SNARE-associated domain